MTRYRIVIEDPVKSIQVFANSEVDADDLAKQYLGMLEPGKTAQIFAAAETKVKEITSSQVGNGAPYQFEERNLNEQATS